jgi:hypothetical protein
LKQSRSGPDYVAPRNSSEWKISSVWANVLDPKRIGVHDNFFELGRQSVAGLRVVNQLRKALGKRLSLVIFFRVHKPKFDFEIGHFECVQCLLKSELM